MSATRVRPDELAAAILAEHHPAGALPIPIEPIAQSLGYTLLRNHHDGLQVSFFLRDAAGRPHVGVNTAIGRGAQRFALAHALCHGLMHASDLTVCAWLRVDPEPGPGRAALADERDATRFATDLLMPAHRVIEEAGRVLAAIPADRARGGPQRRRMVDVLAGVFRVSHEAISYRLVELAVLST